jgi:pyruvate formate lyase activating enzyme
MREAMFYEKLEAGEVRCFLCGHRCLIRDKKYGICGARQNKGGTLYTHAYGRVIAANVDPVEKKPLYHFLPGNMSFSVATIGCNFRCGFCQNWQISQAAFRDWASESALGRKMSPDEIVRCAQENGCSSISYTYTEPTIFYEYALEIATRARQQGLKNIFVTNGFMTRECIEAAAQFLDAANVDLKSFSDETYQRVCNGRLQPVLDSIAAMKAAGIWVEVTTLVVPGENDSADELKAIARFIAGVKVDIPWHISRFHPDYKFTDYVATPEETLKAAYEFGKQAGLRYVYAGNVHGWGNDTLCHSCGKPLIKREGFTVTENVLVNGSCPNCHTLLAGIFS